MEATASLLSPTAIAAHLVWNFAVMASVQLTVRLIRAFSVGRTAMAAGLLTAVTVPLTMLLVIVGRSNMWALAACLLTVGFVGAVLVSRVLRFRRRRSVVVAAVGIGLLAGPWGAYLVRAG
jgi:hypothetical protein